MSALDKIILLILILIAVALMTGCGSGGSSSGGQPRYQGSDRFVEAMTKAERKYSAGKVSQIVEGGTPWLAGYDRNSNRIHFGNEWSNYENDDLAGVLAHENAHAKQPASRNHEHAVQKELQAYAVQVEFLQSIGRHDLAGFWASQDGRHVCE